MAILTNTAHKEVDTSGSLDAALVICALSLEVSSVTVEKGYDPATAEKSIYEGIAIVKDNCAGETRFEVDDSGVNYNKKGRYTAHVYGYDMIGNKSEKVALTVEVVDSPEEN